MSGGPPDSLPLPVLPPTATGGRAVQLMRLVRDALRLEDLILIVWVAFQPALLAALRGGPAAGAGVADPFSGHDPLTGLIELAAAAAALLCVATRPADGPTVGQGSLVERGVVGPLTGGFLLVTAVGSQNLFGSGDAGFGLALGAVVVAVLLRAVLPAVPSAWRRALVTPYVLVSTSLFSTVLAQVDGLFDMRGAFASGAGGAIQVLPPLVGLVVLFCAVFYLMLVYAPRQMAQPDGGAMAWLLRFAVFVIAEIVATTLFGVAA